MPTDSRPAHTAPTCDDAGCSTCAAPPTDLPFPGNPHRVAPAIGFGLIDPKNQDGPPPEGEPDFGPAHWADYETGRSLTRHGDPGRCLRAISLDALGAPALPPVPGHLEAAGHMRRHRHHQLLRWIDRYGLGEPHLDVPVETPLHAAVPGDVEDALAERGFSLLGRGKQAIRVEADTPGIVDVRFVDRKTWTAVTHQGSNSARRSTPFTGPLDSHLTRLASLVWAPNQFTPDSAGGWVDAGRPQPDWARIIYLPVSPTHHPEPLPHGATNVAEFHFTHTELVPYVTAEWERLGLVAQHLADGFLAPRVIPGVNDRPGPDDKVTEIYEWDPNGVGIYGHVDAATNNGGVEREPQMAYECRSCEYRLTCPALPVSSPDDPTPVSVMNKAMVAASRARRRLGDPFPDAAETAAAAFHQMTGRPAPVIHERRLFEDVVAERVAAEAAGPDNVVQLDRRRRKSA